MKVLTVIPGVTSDAGAERSLVAMTPGLIDSGIDLHVAVLTHRQALVPELATMGAAIHDLSSSSNLVSRIRALRRTLEAVKPDLIHATLFEASQVVLLSSFKSKVPVLITWANTDYTPESAHGVRFGRVKFGMVRWWEIALSQFTRPRYHAVTQGVASYNGNRLKVPEDRIKVGERGRDAAALRAAAGDRVATRALLGLDPKARLVISVGRQDYQKAHSALVTVFDQYADAHPADRLVIVGRRGTGSVALEAAISAMRNPEAVTVLGHRDDVPALVASADAAVCSSLKEGAAGSLIEAMALGTPVVSVPLLGLRDVLIDGKNARVAPLHELPAILDELFNDPMQVERLTAEARSDAEGRFSIAGSATRLGEIFAWAAQ